MFKKAVEKNPYHLGDFPDRFKTQEACERAVEDDPEAIEYVPDHFKILREPYSLGHIPDNFKTQKMCEKLLKKTHGGCMLSLTVLKSRDVQQGR